MSVKLLTEHHLEFLSLEGSRTDPSESILVKISHCWQSHFMAHLSKTKQRNRKENSYCDFVYANVLSYEINIV